MGQEETRAMLTAVEWANTRLAELGLGDTLCVVHARHAARLCRHLDGRELLVFEDGDGSMADAVVGLVEYFEEHLREFLSGFT